MLMENRIISKPIEKSDQFQAESPYIAPSAVGVVSLVDSPHGPLYDQVDRILCPEKYPFKDLGLEEIAKSFDGRIRDLQIEMDGINGDVSLPDGTISYVSHVNFDTGDKSKKRKTVTILRKDLDGKILVKAEFVDHIGHSRWEITCTDGIKKGSFRMLKVNKWTSSPVPYTDGELDAFTTLSNLVDQHMGREPRSQAFEAPAEKWSRETLAELSSR